MIAIDSSILIDLIGADTRASAAEECLRKALAQGPVVACEVVIAEVVAGLGQSTTVMEALDEAGIAFSPLEYRAAARAGEMQRRYKQRRPTSAMTLGVRTVPDFLIGAHALLQCTGLITRDDGFFRDYFKGLKVIVPKPA